MRLLCPAKINLHLRVGPRRDDGFHSLLSWFCTAGLFDNLTLQEKKSPASADVSLISLSCDQADLPTDARNLVVKAGLAWSNEARQIAGTSVGNVDAVLNKRIPFGAGLGGGSSDAARALAGLNRLWNCGANRDILSRFSQRLGSDLSFFFHGPSSICAGRGEIVRPISPPRPRSVLLILPPIEMPTADVYRRFDAMGLGNESDISHEPDWAAWARLDAKELLAQLINDLEPPAFAINPSLAQLRREIEILLARQVRMSGSGSSLFTIYDTMDEARHVKSELHAAFSTLRIEPVELAPDFSDDLSTESEIGV